MDLKCVATLKLCGLRPPRPYVPSTVSETYLRSFRSPSLRELRRVPDLHRQGRVEDYSPLRPKEVTLLCPSCTSPPPTLSTPRTKPLVGIPRESRLVPEVFLRLIHCRPCHLPRPTTLDRMDLNLNVTHWNPFTEREGLGVKEVETLPSILIRLIYQYPQYRNWLVP